MFFCVSRKSESEPVKSLTNLELYERVLAACRDAEKKYPSLEVTQIKGPRYVTSECVEFTVFVASSRPEYSTGLARHLEKTIGCWMFYSQRKSIEIRMSRICKSAK